MKSKTSYIIIVLLLAIACKVQSQELWDSTLLQQIAFENLETINTEDHEMSSFLIGDSLVFVKFKQQSRKEKPTRGERDFDLYKAIKIDNQFSETSSFDDHINSKYIEGPGAFHEASNTLFFTRSHIDGDKKSSIVKLKVYRSTKDQGEWQDAQELDIVLGDFNFCHPAISHDGRTMIFASDMPGGYGKMDLYIVEYADGEWGKPINMGPNVNSEYNEIFPTIFRGKLFFSNDVSDNLDIYMTSLKEYKLNNTNLLPYPFNSDRDDFSLTIERDGEVAYLTSNRSGGAGADDLYRMVLPKEMFNKDPNATNINIVVLDKLKLEPLDNAMVSITKIDLSESDLLNLITSDLVLTDQDELILKLKPNTHSEPYVSVGAEGSLFAEIDVTKSYLVKTKSPNFEVNSMIIRPKKDLTNFTVLLNPIAEPIIEKPIIRKEEIFIPTTAGTTIVFDNIYYGSNSAEIKAGAAKELDALSLAMKENPNLKVQLSAHTDSRGKESYNQVLSEKRAISAKNYLVKTGVKADRIVAVGYGESRIRNHCIDGIECSNEEHRYNRRTEVTILSN